MTSDQVDLAAAEATLAAYVRAEKAIGGGMTRLAESSHVVLDELRRLRASLAEVSAERDRMARVVSAAQSIRKWMPSVVETGPLGPQDPQSRFAYEVDLYDGGQR